MQALYRKNRAATVRDWTSYVIVQVDNRMTARDLPVAEWAKQENVRPHMSVARVSVAWPHMSVARVSVAWPHMSAARVSVAWPPMSVARVHETL